MPTTHSACRGGTHWKNKKRLLYMVFNPAGSPVNFTPSRVATHDVHAHARWGSQQDARRACTDAEGHSADDDGKHFH